MSEIIKDSHSFVGYEYKEVTANPEKISFFLDGYRNFGWEVDDNIDHAIPTSINISRVASNITPRMPSGSYARAVLRLKRDRKIMNKMELTRLQRNFEFCMKEIDVLENSKTSKATMYALIVGILGTAFMAASIFAVTATPPMIALCIFLAIPAFAGWIAPYYVYKIIVKKRTEKVSPLIEEKQEEVYEILEKGNRLLFK